MYPDLSLFLTPALARPMVGYETEIHMRRVPTRHGRRSPDREADMSVNELSVLLFKERELLELLLFKLEEEQLLLTAGKARWLPHATREVEQVMERLRSAGLSRTIEVAAVSTEWGTAQDATLRDLVTAAPDGPWGDILSAHYAAMAEFVSQISHVRDINQNFLRGATRSTQETLASLDHDAGTYGAGGGAATTGSGARLLDQKA